jgi:hypothetical protein
MPGKPITNGNYLFLRIGGVCDFSWPILPWIPLPARLYRYIGDACSAVRQALMFRCCRQG